jgi:hypothetical protein
MVVVGYSTGFIVLVALAIIVGYKFYHDHCMAGGNVAATGPGNQPNSANPATGPSSMGLKY